MGMKDNIKNPPVHTKIIVSSDEDMPYGYCKIPPRFFERALERKRKNTETKTLLSIRARDGRELLTVET